MEVKPIAWSHTRAADFKACPLLFHHKVNLKNVPFVETPAMAEGKRMHKSMEDRVALNTPLPLEYAKYEPVALSIIHAPGQAFVERQITLTQSMTPTGWFAKDAWLRVQVDVMKITDAHGWAGDYKSGKIKFDEHQLKLTAATMMTEMPQLQSVTTSFLWMQFGCHDSTTYKREQLPQIWAELLVTPERIQECAATNHWPAKPGRHCRWCPVNGQRKCSAASVPFNG